VEDCFDGTLRNTRLAIDALIGMDVEHLIPLVKTLDGAHHHAIGVLAGKTRLGDDVRHDLKTPRIKGGSGRFTSGGSKWS
jgi:hypothetical protein